MKAHFNFQMDEVSEILQGFPIEICIIEAADFLDYVSSSVSF